METFFTVRRLQRDIVLREHMSAREVSGVIVRFYTNVDFLDKF